MTIFGVLASVSTALAALAALMFLNNLRHFRRPRPNPRREREPLSVIIPARNEAANIRDCVQCVLRNRDVEFEVIVVDDHSDDETAAIVRDLMARDNRVRLENAPPLPVGWCGKQHACWWGAEQSRFGTLAFLDADVRLNQDALASMIDQRDQSRAELASGFPRQTTGSILEKLVIPLIHFVLLAYLPMGWMRRTTHPAFSAGCGQLVVARRSTYNLVGGHGAVRSSLMDGITLPKAFRQAGFRTDVFDATEIATCRMYRNAREVWLGLAKNAVEGMAAPGRILPFTLLLAGGHILPFVLLPFAPLLPKWIAIFVVLGVLLPWLPRLVGVVRFRQSMIGALLHPLGVTLLLAIQWHALLRSVFAKPATWRGREYSSSTSGGDSSLKEEIVVPTNPTGNGGKPVSTSINRKPS